MNRFSRLEKAGALGYPSVPYEKDGSRRSRWLIGMAPLAAWAQSSIVSQIAGDKAATESFYFSLKFGLNVAHLKGPEEAARTGGLQRRAIRPPSS